ncbi:MAG: deoxyribodipyrimidine photo-lyase [Burkholderiaceae bacterium]|nr:deoxyribodipyrimidine photo-lyase [Burkholderiaceae bacterium]
MPNSPPENEALVWLRRDLRLDDHAALAHALHEASRIHVAFVFDTEILDALPSRRDRRVEFIHASVQALDADLRRLGGGLWVCHGRADDEIPRLATVLGVGLVVAAHDDEPEALARDARVAGRLEAEGRSLVTVKDQVVLERAEVLTATGKPFQVFTPYRRAWLRQVRDADLSERRVALASRLAPTAPPPCPSLADIGFQSAGLSDLPIEPGSAGASARLEEFAGRIGDYHRRRDFPGRKGPSYLSVHLRFGTISIRQVARLAWQAIAAGGPDRQGAEVWLSELIWREFYFQILWHHPHVVSSCFRPEYDAIEWEDDESAFEAWCEGRTGYPIVDAAMRQLNQTGYMHNRLRMVTASFLVKDLGIDWRRGEHYFADRLNDYDLAANNGGWQWAASTGCDAQPWFRIFNPVTQSNRFDADGGFIRRYVPELEALDDKAIHAPWLASASALAVAGIVLGRSYPRPIVDHALARQRTLDRFAAARKGDAGHVTR